MRKLELIKPSTGLIPVTLIPGDGTTNWSTVGLVTVGLGSIIPATATSAATPPQAITTPTIPAPPTAPSTPLSPPPQATVTLPHYQKKQNTDEQQRHVPPHVQPVT